MKIRRQHVLLCRQIEEMVSFHIACGSQVDCMMATIRQLLGSLGPLRRRQPIYRTRPKNVHIGPITLLACNIFFRRLCMVGRGWQLVANDIGLVNGIGMPRKRTARMRNENTRHGSANSMIALDICHLLMSIRLRVCQLYRTRLPFCESHKKLFRVKGHVVSLDSNENNHTTSKSGNIRMEKPKTIESHLCRLLVYRNHTAPSRAMITDRAVRGEAVGHRERVARLKIHLDPRANCHWLRHGVLLRERQRTHPSRHDP